VRLVFPAATVLPPHVGKAALGGVATVRVFEVEKLGALDDAILEAEEIVAARVGFDGRRLAQEAAKVNEMLLIGGRLGARQISSGWAGSNSHYGPATPRRVPSPGAPISSIMSRPSAIARGRAE